MSAVNEVLRDHVTRVGFNLSITKTQIDTFRILADSHRGIEFDHRYSWFITGINGLRNRGLVTHVNRESGDSVKWPIHEHFPFTAAGELVLELLREAGVIERHPAKRARRAA